MGSPQISVQDGLEQVVRRFLPEATVCRLRKLTGGASQQTWSFDAVLPTGEEEPLILRQAGVWSGEEASDNVALRDEAALIKRVAAAGVPVPRVYYVLELKDGLGEGFIMERVAGETLPQRILANDDLADARSKLARQCGEILGRVHTIPTEDLPFLREASPEQELTRQLEEYRSHGVRRPVFELAFRWLQDNLPKGGYTPALVHGDFRNGNLMVGPDGLRAVLDWEMAHIGDPLEDLGWLCVNSWRFGKELPVGGFGTREQLFAGYEAATGRPVDTEAVTFWEVYGTLKWGVICQVMAMAYKNGADRSVERAVIGRRTSEAEVDLLHLLAPLTGKP